MTRTAKTLIVVFGLALLVSVSRGGQYIGEARWGHAAAAYATAALCLAGLLREVGHVWPDNVQDQPPAIRKPGVRARINAARQTRRTIRSMRCRCDRYWSSVGTEHDRWCPKFQRNSA
ncbi:hypothetical protein ACFVH9_08560 [Streptomyces hirsutus]|uniref:hypothetical protein n=1 Tax=Streptomyces hirsutus TaxID=35620 RepID=UPI0036339F97